MFTPSQARKRSPSHPIAVPLERFSGRRRQSAAWTILAVLFAAPQVSPAFAGPTRGTSALENPGSDGAYAESGVAPQRSGWPFPSRILAEPGSPPADGEGTARMPGEDVPLGGTGEPTIAVNPTDPLNIAYASLELRVSTDGGSTWQDAVSALLPVTHLLGGDPSVTFDAEGRLFWTYLGVPPCDTWPPVNRADIFIAQCNPSTGEILPGYPVNLTEQIGLPACSGSHNDKAWLAADSQAASPFADRLYAAWTRISGSSMQVITSHSSDQGITWSAAVVLQPFGGGWNWPVHLTVAPNGDVYAAYHRQPGFAGGAPNGISGHVDVRRSTDGGVTYLPATTAFPPGDADMTWNRQTEGYYGQIPGAEFLLVGSVQPWVLADPNIPGRVYVVASDDPDNDVDSGDAANVRIATSTDFGATWGPPTRVDSGPGTTFQVMPTASIHPVTGAIVVHYYDNRNGLLNPDGNYLLDTFATVSFDGGVSFLPDFQVNDLPFDPDRGAGCRYDCGVGIFDVWADAGGKAYGVTDSGHFLSYDGSVWTDVQPTSTPKFGVWGSSPTDIFLCGAVGEILHFDGSGFTQQNSGTTNHLYAIDGRSASDVYAVGTNGTVVHYDGFSWSPINPPTSEDLWDVWANPAGDVWVVGLHDTVYRYDGIEWYEQPLESGDPGLGLLLGVWGTGDDDVWVASYLNGDLHHWDDTWTTTETGMFGISRVWGTSSTDVFVATPGGVLHYDGSGWSLQNVPGAEINLNVHGTATDNVFLVGFGSFIAQYDGSNWTPQENPLTPTHPTRRIGEYNGVAVADQQAFLVWCGNTVDEPIGQQTIFDSFPVEWPADVVDLGHPAASVELEAMRPNPTHRLGTVAYSLPTSSIVDLSLVDAQGRRVVTLVHGAQPAGRHVLSWNGEDAGGEELATGVYFLRLNAGEEVRTRKVTVVG